MDIITSTENTRKWPGLGEKCPVPFASLCFPDFPEDGSVDFQNTVHSVEWVLSMVLNQDPGLLFFSKLIVI